jgi:hypothetical protein
MITVYAQQDDLVDKHKNLLDELKWSDDLSPRPNLVKAFPSDINKGVMDDKGVLLPMMASIYVDDILAAAARRENMMKLLAAIIKAIFIVCGTPDTEVRQCLLSLEKLHELIVGPRQIVLGLVIDTYTMTVGILDNYINKVRDLLSSWDPKKRFFKVNDMQKLVRKLARLGEGAPWISKLMSYLYTSLAFALKSNTELLEKSSSGFRDLVKQITTKTFTEKSQITNGISILQ